MVAHKHFKPHLSSRFLPSFVLFLALNAFAGSLQAQVIDWPKTTLKVPSSYVMFVDPNEKKPVDQLSILALASPGLLMTVGTERGFITASLTDKISEVLFIDLSPGIVLFNQVNIELLKLAKNREDYLSLRLPHDFSAWNNSSSLLLKNLEIQNFWTENVLKNSFFDYFHNKASVDKFEMYVKQMGFEPFKNANYLTDDILFNRVHKLALENKVQALNIDLGGRGFADLVDKLKAAKKKISILDVSNAWSNAFLGVEKTAILLERADKIASPDTLLLFTRPVSSTYEIAWRYESFNFKFIRTQSPRAYGAFYLKYMMKSGFYPTDGAVYNGNDARMKTCDDAFARLIAN